MYYYTKLENVSSAFVFPPHIHVSAIFCHQVW